MATAAIVAAIVAGTTVFQGAGPLTDSSTVAADVEPRTSGDPEEISSAFFEAVSTVAALNNVVWKSSRVQALDSANNPIEGPARMDAIRWEGVFTAGEGQELRMVLIKEAPMTGNQAERDCSTRLELGHAVTCEISQAGDAVVQQITRGAEPDPDGWPLVLPKDFDSQGKNLWLMQQSILRYPNGTTIYVAEVANATTWDEATSLWVFDRADMTSLASELARALAP